MAEGDSIWRLARRLRNELVGSVVVASKFRVPRFATSDLTGASVLDVQPKGKHLLMRFDNGVTVHSHLRMDGSWRWHRREGWRPGARSDDVRAWLDFGDDGVLAAHSMPVLELLPTAAEHTVIGYLGPDILDPAWDSDASSLPAIARANIERTPDRSIAEAIMDQRNLCGIGNLYKVEGLFLTGVYPFTPVRDVKDIDHVLDLCHRLMMLNLRSGRSKQPTTGDLRKGHTHWVYGRYNDPCLRCATPIAFAEGGSDPYDRVTWWCPHCQPMSGGQ